MRFSTILSTISLVLGLTTAKAIDNSENDTIKNNYTELIETENFKYTFNCLEDNNGVCAYLKRDINIALDNLLNALEFNQPITFEIYVDDLSKYGFPGDGGINIDTNFVPLRLSNDTNSAPYLFPQSLVRQLNIDKEPNYKSYDFIIAINNFKNNSDVESIKMDEVLLHEIIHALGFLSLSYVRELELNDEPELNNQMVPLIPEPVLKVNNNNTIKFVPEFMPFLDLDKFNVETKDEFNQQKATSKVGFYPLSIFEKNIVDVNTKSELFSNLGYYFQEFENCFTDNSTYSSITYSNYLECYNKLSTEKKEYITSLTDNYLMKSGTIGFLTDNGNVIPLQTMDNIFSPGTSISHSSYKDNDMVSEEEKPKIICEMIKGNFYNNTDYINKYYDENFLMNIAMNDIPKDLLQENLTKSNRHDLMGNGIVDILKTIGWTEKGEIKNNKMYYLAEDIEIAQQNRLKYLGIATKFNDIPIIVSDEDEDEDEYLKQCAALENNTEVVGNYTEIVESNTEVVEDITEVVEDITVPVLDSESDSE